MLSYTFLIRNSIFYGKDVREKIHLTFYIVPDSIDYSA